MSQIRERASHGWSLRIATVAGIPVRIHLSFVLLLLWVGWLAYHESSRVFAWLLPGVFFCVILHEFGHAMVARAFGIRTRSITLYPIGGVAAIESMPKPVQEFWIALAGPAVNVVLALIFGMSYFALTGKPPSFSAGMNGGSYLEGLYAANVVLPVFNMIPAFPMDGGRVLRAFLAFFLREPAATQVAGSIGQLLAMGFGFLGLLTGNVVLVLIAVFVFMGAGQEAQIVQTQALLSGRRLEEAMMTRFVTVSEEDTVRDGARHLLEGSQEFFPVTRNGDVVGILTRDDIVRALAETGPETAIKRCMTPEFARHEIGENFEGFFTGPAESRRLPAVVYRDGHLVGLLSAQNLAEFLMLEEASRRQSSPAIGPK